MSNESVLLHFVQSHKQTLLPSPPFPTAPSPPPTPPPSPNPSKQQWHLSSVLKSRCSCSTPPSLSHAPPYPQASPSLHHLSPILVNHSGTFPSRLSRRAAAVVWKWWSCGPGSAAPPRPPPTLSCCRPLSQHTAYTVTFCLLDNIPLSMNTHCVIFCLLDNIPLSLNTHWQLQQQHERRKRK